MSEEEGSCSECGGEVITRAIVETERYRRLPDEVLETIHANSLRRFEVARKKLQEVEALNLGSQKSPKDHHVLQIRKKVYEDELRTLRVSSRVLKERKLGEA